MSFTRARFLVTSSILLPWVLSGCGKTAEEPPQPGPPLTPPVTQVSEPLPSPTPPPNRVAVRLPAWVEDGLRGQVAKVLQDDLPGREIILIDADDPARNQKWDIALLPFGKSRFKPEIHSPWVLDTLHLYANTVSLARRGAAIPLKTWEQVEEAALSQLPGASSPPFLALPGDLPGLPRTLEALASLAGATSETRVTARPVGMAMDFLFSLHRRRLFTIGDEGISASTAARLMLEGRSGITLAWETEGGSIADVSRSPVASRIQMMVPPQFAGGLPVRTAPSRLWCWTPSEAISEDSEMALALKHLAALDPGAAAAGKWIGGNGESAQGLDLSDLFIFESRPGQDFRDTAHLVRESWDHQKKSADILRGFEIRFGAKDRRR